MLFDYNGSNLTANFSKQTDGNSNHSLYQHQYRLKLMLFAQRTNDNHDNLSVKC